METDTAIEFYINAFLLEEGFKTHVFPINLGQAVPLSWYIIIETKPNLMVTVDGGVLRLERLKLGEPLGEWDLAHPTSFEDLVLTVRAFLNRNLTMAW